MKVRRQIWTGIWASIGMLILILDAKTALEGAKDGLELSFRVVLPSLFPFFVLSFLIGKAFMGTKIAAISPLGKLCGIPKGAESILLLGFVGGYPVGTQSVANAYGNGDISRQDAGRMLGFCSNAGPAFIFGIAGNLFTSEKTIWVLWAIHILSGVLVGCILPRNRQGQCSIRSNTSVSIPTAVENSIRSIGLVCAWVVIFRVVIAFLKRWFLWILPGNMQIALTGILELTNGCTSLYTITNEGLRFVLCAVFLSFGGLCVAMQTVSATKKLGTGMYFPGKILQSVFSFFLAVPLQYIIFSKSEVVTFPTVLYFFFVLCATVAVIYLYRPKKIVAIPC